jgi:hypothetical protein
MKQKVKESVWGCDDICSPLDIDVELIPLRSRSHGPYSELLNLTTPPTLVTGQPCVYGINLGKTMDKPFVLLILSN